MGFKDLSIVKKLAVGFGAVLVVLSLSSAFVLKQTLDLSEVERLNSVSDTALDLVDRAIADGAKARAAGYKVVISGDLAEKPEYLAAKAGYKRDLADLKAIVDKDAPQFASKLAEAEGVGEAYFGRFLESQTNLAVAAGTHQQSVDSVLSSASIQARQTYESAVNALRGDVSKWSDDFTVQADRLMSAMIWVVALSGAFSVAVGTLMACFIARSIGRPMNAMSEAMRALAGGNHDIEIPARDQKDEMGHIAAAVQTFKEAAIQKVRLEADAEASRRGTQVERERAEAARAVAAQQQAQVVGSIADGLTKLAAGDLLQRIDQPFASDYESLRGDFNAAVVQLQTTIKEVLTTTGQIRNGTGEIVSASDDLSRRTEQQAANLEETAAALAEISSAMKRTAEGASHARQVVGTAQQTAEHSNQVISRTITAMDSIDDASRKISQIIGVIDEIAFQTNLLALNAGVEAARAGEAGRGFAVVASEVRALAQRCAEAAKEVKTLVRSSEEHVKVGVDLVGESGAMLAQIVKQVAELKGIVENIANSAETQAMGLSEVNVAVTQLDQVTQQNAAMAEEATAAAHQLAQEGSELVRLVGRFNVGSTQVVETRPAPPPRAAAKPAPRPQLKRVAGGAPVEAPATDRDGWQEF